MCRSHVEGCRISSHVDAMTALARKSDRLSRDHRSHTAPRVAWRKAMISRSLVKGCRISNHGDAMIARTKIPTGFLAMLGAIPPLACQGRRR